jgi:hypothetical protein
MKALASRIPSGNAERMDHCGAPTAQINDESLTDKQLKLIASFDNECLEDSGHIEDHVVHRGDGAQLRWSSEEPGRFAFYEALAEQV